MGAWSWFYQISHRCFWQIEMGELCLDQSELESAVGSVWSKGKEDRFCPYSALACKETSTCQDQTNIPQFFQLYWLIRRRCLLKRRYITGYRQHKSEIAFRGAVECQPVLQYKVITG